MMERRSSCICWRYEIMSSVEKEKPQPGTSRYVSAVYIASPSLSPKGIGTTIPSSSGSCLVVTSQQKPNAVASPVTRLVWL